MTQPLSHVSLFAISELLLILFFLLCHIERRSCKRAWQLKQAAELMRQHANNLEKFLSDHGSPADLKAVLIGCSDALADEAIANELAGILLANHQNPQPITPDVEALVAAIEDLRGKRPDLVHVFFRAVGSGVAAALFRWPHAARTLEILATRVVADPSNELRTAAVGARLRGDFRLGMRPAAATAVA